MSLSNRPHLTRLLSVRKPLHHPDFPVILLWAHKAGCTFLLKWFLWQLGLLEEARAYGRKRSGLAVHVYENQVLKAREGYIEEMTDRILQGTTLINLVRSPYARIFSSYLHLNDPRLLQIIAQNQQSPALNLRLQVLRATQGDAAAPDSPIGFGDFLTWLEQQESAHLDAHIRPQTTALYSLPGVRHYRLENADTVLSELEAEFELRDSRHYRKSLFYSGHHHPKATLSADETLALLQRGVALDRPVDAPLPRIDRAVLEQTPFIDIIERVYAADIALYNSLH